MKSRPMVAVSSPSFAKDPTLISELGLLSLDFKVNPSGKRLDETELIAFLRQVNADAAVVGLEPITARVLDSCPNVRFIAKYGVGLDNIDEQALRQRGIGLGWTGGVNRRSVSELVLAFMLGHFRNVIPSVIKMNAGVWEKEGGRQLSDATIGIVGLGHIGHDLAQLLIPFGCRILYTDILDLTDKVRGQGIVSVTYQQLLRESDVVTFHVPLTKATRCMYGKQEIAETRPEALVVNTSRGEIVDFTAVCAAVTSGRLGGFACDVFPVEPCDARKIIDGNPNFYFTPHIGGNAREAV